MAGLETIDDETDASDVVLVKVSEIQEAREEFGDSVVGDEMPSLVFFDDKVPSRFEGSNGSLFFKVLKLERMQMFRFSVNFQFSLQEIYLRSLKFFNG